MDRKRREDIEVLPTRTEEVEDTKVPLTRTKATEHREVLPKDSKDMGVMKVSLKKTEDIEASLREV